MQPGGPGGAKKMMVRFGVASAVAWPPLTDGLGVGAHSWQWFSGCDSGHQKWGPWVKTPRPTGCAEERGLSGGSANAFPRPANVYRPHPSPHPQRKRQQLEFFFLQ